MNEGQTETDSAGTADRHQLIPRGVTSVST
jgi:hypothetical protein